MKTGHLHHLEVVVVNTESHAAASQVLAHRTVAGPSFLAARVVVVAVEMLKEVVEVSVTVQVVQIELIVLGGVAQEVVVEQVVLIHEEWMIVLEIVLEVLPLVPSRFEQELEAHWVDHRPLGPQEAQLA